MYSSCSAVVKVSEGYRPDLSPAWHPDVVSLIDRLWAQDPKDRPLFSEVVAVLKVHSAEIVAHMEESAAPSGCGCVIG